MRPLPARYEGTETPFETVAIALRRIERTGTVRIHEFADVLDALANWDPDSVEAVDITALYDGVVAIAEDARKRRIGLLRRPYGEEAPRPGRDPEPICTRCRQTQLVDERRQPDPPLELPSRASEPEVPEPEADRPKLVVVRTVEDWAEGRPRLMGAEVDDDE